MQKRAHITDSLFYGHSYATETSRDIFSDMRKLQRFMEVETVLAHSQAELGVIPKAAALAIEKAALLEELDAEQIAEDIRESGHSLVAVIRAMASACPDRYGEYVHYGATTQDIQDTAQSLEMKEVIGAVEQQTEEILDHLEALCRTHRSTLMTGRTHGRAALPITFGLKVAVWMDELLRTLERIEQMKERVLVVELFGGVGTMVGFGPKARELAKTVAQNLDLKLPLVAWHSSRDRIAEFVSVLGSLTATLAKIADEIRTLGRPEFNELKETWNFGKISSSTMPHKRNPEKCQQVVVLSKLAKNMVGSALDAMHNEHERDSRGLRLEWAVVPDISHYTLAALNLLKTIISGLEIHTEVMAGHARQTNDELATEAVMLELAPEIGKNSAYELVYELAQQAQSEGQSIKQTITENKTVKKYLEHKQLEELFNPQYYLGHSAELVDGVLDAYDQWKSEHKNLPK